VSQGSVEIKDGDTDASSLLIDIEKRGQTQQQVDYIIVQQTLFDVGRGTIFVLQLVHETSLPTMPVIIWVK